MRCDNATKNEATTSGEPASPATIRGALHFCDYLPFGYAKIVDIVAGVAAPHVKSSRLRALAITSAQESALFPGLPTVAASRLPGYEAIQLWEALK